MTKTTNQEPHKHDEPTAYLPAGETRTTNATPPINPQTTKFRKKPVVVDAIHWLGGNYECLNDPNQECIQMSKTDTTNHKFWCAMNSTGTSAACNCQTETTRHYIHEDVNTVRSYLNSWIGMKGSKLQNARKAFERIIQTVDQCGEGKLNE